MTRHTEPPYTYPTDVVEGGERAQTMPEGFRKISVILTEKEYRALYREALFTPSGTASEAARKRMGLPDMPYGFKKAWKEHLARR